MILFGVAEVFTGLFLGHSIGVSTANSTVFALEGPAIGALYVIGGFLLLTGKKWAAGLAELCLVADVVGRVHLALTGVYPFVGIAAVAVVIGTSIAIFFAIYIGLKWRFFK
jgi:uncharacterized membrane protein (UPF0136 family)